MPVKSWIVHAYEDQTQNSYTVHGVAFSGERGISSVEFSIDGEIWKQAELYGIDLGPNAWRCFRFQTDSQTSPKQIYTRATDTVGDQQPKDRIENEQQSDQWCPLTSSLGERSPVLKIDDSE